MADSGIALSWVRHPAPTSARSGTVCARPGAEGLPCGPTLGLFGGSGADYAIRSAAGALVARDRLRVGLR